MRNSALQITSAASKTSVRSAALHSNLRSRIGRLRSIQTSMCRSLGGPWPTALSSRYLQQQKSHVSRRSVSLWKLDSMWEERCRNSNCVMLLSERVVGWLAGWLEQVVTVWMTASLWIRTWHHVTQFWVTPYRTMLDQGGWIVTRCNAPWNATTSQRLYIDMRACVHACNGWMRNACMHASMYVPYLMNLWVSWRRIFSLQVNYSASLFHLWVKHFFSLKTLFLWSIAALQSLQLHQNWSQPLHFQEDKSANHDKSTSYTMSSIIIYIYYI